ncbi:MAG: DUF2779 domain-containing protein [Helicobacteraceae bacterium]|nr:DUF2779 domain-containing protein [Helicobacteraceae bacterium]
MDASLLFRLLSCEKARYLHACGEAPRKEKKREPIVSPSVMREVQKWFNSLFSHPLSFKKASYKDFSVFVDRIAQNKNSFELSKPLFSSEPYSAAINEMALAIWILEKRCMKIDKAFVYYIDKEYVKEGDLNFDKLFIKRDVTKKVYNRYFHITDKLGEGADASKLCDLDLACPYAHICFADIPKYSILNMAGLSKELKTALFRQNILNPADIPESLLSDYQKIQIKCDKTKKAHIDFDALKSFIDEIKYPIYFLDFEAIHYAAPIFDKLKPFDALAFQFSLHTLTSSKSRLKHDEFIAECDIDARSQIAEKLCDLIGDEGSVIAYGAQFEKAVIKGLADLFPSRRTKLLSIFARIVDLSIAFEKRWYYHANMRGSHALKAVAPAMIRGASYDGEVKNGAEAVESYLAMHSANEQNRRRLRRELLNYCKKDTECLVKIYRKLVRLTQPKRKV